MPTNAVAAARFSLPTIGCLSVLSRALRVCRNAVGEVVIATDRPLSLTTLNLVWLNLIVVVRILLVRVRK